jgi:hypothetical protein
MSKEDVMVGKGLRFLVPTALAMRPHEAGGCPYQSIWPVPQVFFLKPAADQNGGSGA